eukprot:784161-Pelagomonas_calceolata.AAC.2
MSFSGALWVIFSALFVHLEVFAAPEAPSTLPGSEPAGACRAFCTFACFLQASQSAHRHTDTLVLSHTIALPRLHGTRLKSVARIGSLPADHDGAESRGCGHEDASETAKIRHIRGSQGQQTGKTGLAREQRGRESAVAERFG